MKNSIIEKLGKNLFSSYYAKAASTREFNIARLISIFPKHKDDIMKNIRNIEIKTCGLEWCYQYASTGKSWDEIKELL